MLKRGGTRLSNIPDHQLYVECACGHTGPVWVRDIVKVYGNQITVADAIERMRRSACRTKMIKDYRITHPGGSADAMRGAEQGRQGV